MEEGLRVAHEHWGPDSMPKLRRQHTQAGSAGPDQSPYLPVIPAVHQLTSPPKDQNGRQRQVRRPGFCAGSVRFTVSLANNNLPSLGLAVPSQCEGWTQDLFQRPPSV